MNRRLSSLLVPLYRLIGIVLFVYATAWLVVDLYHRQSPRSGPIFIFGAIWHLLTFRWKWVQLKSDQLQVSNFIRTISVPVSEIEKVEGSSFFGMQPQTVKITLKAPTIFGDEIVYVPSIAGLNAKLAAKELQQLLRAHSDQ